MEISYRLKCIAAMVDTCDKAIDVGTDHGYIPIHLIKSGVCKEVIASDINKGPVEKARKNVAIEGLKDKISCRLGGGLTALKPGEVDCAIIAGMGGNLIRDIIEESMEVFKELSFAVLQPVQNPEILRKYLYESGYSIIDEEICEDEEKFYEIIKVAYSDKPQILEPIYYEISSILIEKKHPLLQKYIEFKIDKYKKILNYLNEDSEAAQDRKKELEYKIIRLKEIISWLLR
jgi:tRNA (adenine22-N1)-methyltransferase